MKELLLDQVDALEKVSGKINYLSSAVDDSTSLSEGLSSLLFDISTEIGTISNKVHEYLKTQ